MQFFESLCLAASAAQQRTEHPCHRQGSIMMERLDESIGWDQYATYVAADGSF